MDVDLKQFWDRLVGSDILDESVVSGLRSQYETENAPNERDSANLAKWLCERKAISQFQADILLGSAGGQLRYGNYAVIDDQVAGKRQFNGQHVLTGHPVRLTFFDGCDAADLATWRTAQAAATSMVNSPNSNLVRIYEWVAIPEYRFVVSEAPRGKRLSDLVPAKSRILLKRAASIVNQIATALHHFDSLENRPDRLPLSEDLVWVSKTGHVLVEPWLTDADIGNELKEPLSIRFQLGQIWYRLASGRYAKVVTGSGKAKVEKSEFVRLKKYEVPVESIRVIQGLLSDHRTPSFRQVADHCENVYGLELPVSGTSQPSESLRMYEAWLVRTPSVGPESVQLVDELDLQKIADSAEQKLVETSEFETVAKDVFGHTENKSFNADTVRTKRSLFAMFGSLFAVASLIGVVVVLTSGLPNQISNRENAVPPPDEVRATTETNTPPSNDLEEGTAQQQVRPSQGMAQVLVEDDGERLWETPTSGSPIDFSYVPPAPKIAILFRAADLTNSEAGQLLIRSFGPAINSYLESFYSKLAITPEDVEQLLLTLHSNESLSYEPFVLITLNNEHSLDELIDGWSDPEIKNIGNQQYYCTDDEACFVSSFDESGTIKQIGIASERLVKESLQSEGASRISGTMKKLIARSDEERHINAIALRSGLFNEAGQKLMGPKLTAFNRQLALEIDERVRGISLSLHLDGETFVELRFDTTLDLQPEPLQLLVENTIHRLGSGLSSYSSRLTSNSYWDQVVKRTNLVIENITNQLRYGIEDDKVVCNGWFPPAAAHNWFAVSEMLLTYTSAARTELVEVKTVPQTLEELLQLPRDLSVSTSPDLAVLLRNLQQEVVDDFRTLPFDFEIRLMGSDLAKDGITQNQRPSDIAIKQKPLAGILTEIMVSANPDRNIKGPADPECKMVWVVADDPDDSNRRIVLITTRAAAAERSYQLPPEFIPQ